MKFALWVLLISFFCALALADLDIEVESEDPEDDDDDNDNSYQKSNNSRSTYRDQVDNSSWDSAKLAAVGIQHATNDFYDANVHNSEEPWLLVFSKDVVESKNPYNSMESINGILAHTLIAFSQTAEAKNMNLHIGYVDTHNNGELLKETFEIEYLPSIRLLKGDLVCILKWKSGIFTVDEIRAFVSGGYLDAPCTYKRERVADGILLTAEYILNDIAVTRYTEAMEMYITLKKTLEEVLGYKHDLKSVNPSFGKKKYWRKSQMRTLLLHVIIPGSLIMTFIGTVFLTCLCNLICKVFCKKKNGTHDDDQDTSQVVQEEAKKRD